MLRKSWSLLASVLCMAGAGTAGEPQDIALMKNGSQASIQGPADWFTGTAWIDDMFQREAPSRLTGARVTFAPGARTAWHTHPLGQTLIVTAGTGWVQMEGGPVREIHAGDIVAIPPNAKHWHGATPTTTLTHIALQETLDGKNVAWLAHVADAAYHR